LAAASGAEAGTDGGGLTAATGAEAGTGGCTSFGPATVIAKSSSMIEASKPSR
jgi:hypothetical protein